LKEEKFKVALMKLFYSASGNWIDKNNEC